MEYRRYQIFAGAAYYPGGGMNDFAGSHDNKEAAFGLARAKARKTPYEFMWAHVYDCELKRIVYRVSNGKGEEV